MAHPAPRFSARTLESLAERLRGRRAILSRSAEKLHEEVLEATLERDVSDLLDTEDPAADSDTETVLALARCAESLLEEVDDALGRVAAGTYGYCTGCGRGIALVRLRALPATAWCIRCSSPHPQRAHRMNTASSQRAMLQEQA